MYSNTHTKHTCYTQFLSYIHNANNDNDNNNNNKIINMRSESYMYVVCVRLQCTYAHAHTHIREYVYRKCNKETLGPFFLSLQINLYIRFSSVDHIQFWAHSKSHTILDVMNKTTHK